MAILCFAIRWFYPPHAASKVALPRTTSSAPIRMQETPENKGFLDRGTN
jgi:hypothetical protein